ncbi:hypothetical protein SLS59_008812 [Nothophoma quercina]|uniref:Cell wall mannoprotein PIR1-like C-terminal domain-containing protein n=1 Tax=Nothophoma quercina TaxID=749835 RepID=A0ABR3QPV4_9PLEO
MSSPSPLQSHTSTPAPRTAAVSAHPTEFIAELPADLGNLSIAEVKPLEHVPAQPSGQASSYQAYQSPGAQPAPSSPSFNIARRAVSISNVPFADPWRFADPLTELPTREFYVIADLLYDALDRKFEPQNTGMLEASKILRSWIDLTEDAIQLKLSAVPAHGRSYATYMPALNRAGWYKFFFLEMMHGPDNINKLMPALCSETYNPEVLHHPNLATRDKAEAPALQARAAEIQTTTINQAADGLLFCTLEDGVLRDQYSRTGSVVANRQFQFDGPPQAGAIYTGGFSICQNKSLAIGGSARWWRCMSGAFGNLYDESIGDQCTEIRIIVDYVNDPSPSSSLVLPASTTLSLIPTGGPAVTLSSSASGLCISYCLISVRLRHWIDQQLCEWLCYGKLVPYC